MCEVDSGARRPAGKARRPKISGISEGGATPPGGMPRPEAALQMAGTGHKSRGCHMKVAIFGASGTIGRAVVAELLRRGKAPRAVGRSRASLERVFGDGVEIVEADVSDVGGCPIASAGADAIVYSLGLPYSAQAFASYPEMMRAAVQAARHAGVGRLLLITNVYPYGRPTTGRVAETHPRQPVGPKGRFRKEQEDIALAAHEPGRFLTTSLRLPDFYGPHASLALANMIAASSLSGKPANLLGPVDTPHEFVFTPDVGPVVCDLLERDEAFGTPYNFGGPEVITTRQFAERVYAAAGARYRARVAGPLMVRLLGRFSPLMRELSELSYLQSDPVILDDTKLHRTLPTVRKTSYDEGIRLTIEHLREAPARRA
ncbi:MAG: NAD-dependent epimerase/dehydratase family protein [Acidobacteria bacterium]|nr:MAG: NAD-dependent epimerase/dehydratase family protein [Acidobacteriota bacterium]